MEKAGGDEENDGEVEVIEVEAGSDGKEKEEGGEDDREEDREEAEETKDKKKDGEGDYEGEDADNDNEDGREEKSSRAGATTVDLQEVTGDVSNGGVDEDVTGKSDYSEGVKRMDMDQQEMKEGSRLDRTGVG